MTLTHGTTPGAFEITGLPLFMAPPLCITHEQVDDLVERLDATLTDWEESLGVS